MVCFTLLTVSLNDKTALLILNRQFCSAKTSTIVLYTNNDDKEVVLKILRT